MDSGELMVSLDFYPERNAQPEVQVQLIFKDFTSTFGFNGKVSLGC